jgi:hypothetical protein
MYASNPTFTNVIISGNSSGGGGDGGAMFNQQSNLAFINVTIAGNHTDTKGGGLYNWGTSDPIITNTIIWGNSDDGEHNQMYNRDGAVPVVNYSDIQGGWSGAGSNNINADPLFVSHNDDLHQHMISPVINAGTNTLCPAIDLDGVARPIDGVCDMGAYEIERGYLVIFPLMLQ